MLAGRPRLLARLALAVGGAATLVVLAFPDARFAYRSLTLHVVLETSESLIALLLSYLLYGRYCVDRESRHLLLACTFGVLAGADVFLVALPSVAVGGAESFSAWAVLVARFAAGLGMLVAAVHRSRPLGRNAYPIAWLLAPAAAVLGAVAAVVAIGGSAWPAVDADTTGIGLQLATAAVMFSAAAGFSRLARGGDELWAWFSAAAVVAGFARVQYSLFPSVEAPWLYSGDLLRLGFYLLLLAGALSEIGNYWDRAARLAVSEERRRVARDIHDGLAQELALITTLARRLGGVRGSAELASAAQRALDESRRAIAALLATGDEPLEDAVSQAAEEVAARSGAVVHLDLEPGVRTSPETREALVRVVREAVANAARHGQAGAINVTLANSDGISVRVQDDGQGFDVDAAREQPGRFGLVSMQERAAAVGGRLTIRSAPGEGTEVEVWVP